MTEPAATKKCPCVICGAEVEVTKFMAPAKVRCSIHQDVRVATATQIARNNDEPIFLDEMAKESMVELAQMARKLKLDFAMCPQDPDHDVAIKSLVEDPNGAIVTWQCRECLTVICYSTQHRRELLPQGVKELARESAGVQWRESRLGTYPDRDLRGILLGETEIPDGLLERRAQK